MGKLKNGLKSIVGSRHTVGGVMTASIIAVVVVFNAVIYALTALFGLYTDPTEEYDLSISGNTDYLYEEAAALGKEVKIIFCQPEDKLSLHATGKYVQATAREFAARYDFITIEYYNILTEADKLIEYKGDGQLFSSSVIFECDGNVKVVNDLKSSAGFADFYALNASGVPDAYIGEEYIGSMIAGVLSNEHKKVYFTENHGEAADPSLGALLLCAGYDFDQYDEDSYTVNLSKEPVPEDCDLLIISSPTTDFAKPAEGATVRTERDRLIDYLERGGNLFVTIDPYGKSLPVLEGVLASYGIEIASGLDEDGQRVRYIVEEGAEAIYTDGLSFMAGYAEGGIASEIAKDMDRFGSGRVLVSQSGILKLSGDAKPLLVSSSDSVGYLGGRVADREGGYTVAAYSETKGKDGEEGKIFVIPNIYLNASNVMIKPGASNKDFTYALVTKLFGATTATYGTPGIVFDTGTLDGFTMGRAGLYTAIIMAVPVALAVVGTVTIIKRKNR